MHIISIGSLTKDSHIIIIVIIILLFWEFFPPALADDFPLEFAWQQVFSSFLDSSRYSGRS